MFAFWTVPILAVHRELSVALRLVWCAGLAPVRVHVVSSNVVIEFSRRSQDGRQSWEETALWLLQGFSLASADKGRAAARQRPFSHASPGRRDLSNRPPLLADVNLLSWSRSICRRLISANYAAGRSAAYFSANSFRAGHGRLDTCSPGPLDLTQRQRWHQYRKSTATGLITKPINVVLRSTRMIRYHGRIWKASNACDSVIACRHYQAMNVSSGAKSLRLMACHLE